MSWGRIQSAATAATSSALASQTVSYGTNVSSGTKLICAVATDTVTGRTTSPYATVASVKDAGSNSMTLVGHIPMPSATNVGTDVSLWAMDTPSGDVGTKPTLTAQMNSTFTAMISMMIQEVSGLAVGNTLAAMIDGTLGSLGGNGGSSTGSPTYVSTVANEYMVGVYGDDGGPETWVKPAALTADANSINTNSDANCAMAYGNSTGGTEAGSWALSGTAADWGVLLVAFKLASTPVGKVHQANQAVMRSAVW